jgi:hypothetical protein
MPIPFTTPRHISEISFLHPKELIRDEYALVFNYLNIPRIGRLGSAAQEPSTGISGGDPSADLLDFSRVLEEIGFIYIYVEKFNFFFLENMAGCDSVLVGMPEQANGIELLLEDIPDSLKQLLSSGIEKGISDYSSLNADSTLRQYKQKITSFLVSQNFFFILIIYY